MAVFWFWGRTRHVVVLLRMETPMYMALAYGFVGFTAFLILMLLYLAVEHRRRGDN